MMQIVATFEYSLNLELALQALEMRGIMRQRIFAIPLTNRKVRQQLFDSMHSSDGVSLISTGAVLGTACSVVCASLGFELAWGPIYWGLIGAVGGFFVGLGFDLAWNKFLRNRRNRLRTRHPQVVVVIECEAKDADQVEEVLWHHLAMGTARVGE